MRVLPHSPHTRRAVALAAGLGIAAASMAGRVRLVAGVAAQHPTVLLEAMTWREIDAALKGGVDTAVVTIGAVEQHGPQIALSSDSVLGDDVGPAVALAMGRALVAPNIRVGVSAHHMMFPGTIAIRTEVLGDLLREYIHSLAWHGFRHIVVIPTHGGNFATIERVTRQLAPLYPHVNLIGYATTDNYIETLKTTSRRLGIPLDVAGSHAGLSETAQILWLRPDLVRMDQAQPGFMGDAYGAGDRMNLEGTQAVSPNGAIGDPRKASPEIGREYVRDLTAHLVDFARKARDAWRPPELAELPFGGLPDPSGPLADGIRLRRAGRFAQARSFFADRRTKGPGDPAATFELGRTLVLAGQFDEARRSLTPLLDHADPLVRERAHDDLAYTELYFGRFRAAIQHKRDAAQLRAAAKDPVEQAHKLFYVGYIQTETGQFDQAAAAYDEALRLTPGVNDVSLDLEHLYGVLEIARGRLTQAALHLRALEDAIIQKEWAAHVRRFYHLNGETLLARGRVDDALLNFAPAIRIYDHPLYRESLARAYVKAGRLKDAEAEYRHLIDLTDARLDVPIHFVKAHFALAKLLDAAGRRAEADDFYRRFLSFWKDADVALPMIAEARDRVG